MHLRPCPLQSFAYTPTFRFTFYPLLLSMTPADSPTYTSTFLRRIAPFAATQIFFFPSFCLPFSITPVTRRSPSKRPKEGPLWPSRGPGYTYYGPITLPSTFTTFYHSHYRQPRKHMNRFGDRRRIVQVASRRIPHDTKHKTRKRPTYCP